LDLDVLMNAPIRLIRSGLGDVLCRSTSQADWLLSHRLLKTPYHTLPFSLLQEDEAYLLEESESLLLKDSYAMEVLARSLLHSGLGMWIAEGSFPASQGEHMIAHVMEMAFPEQSVHSYHGEQVAVTTVTMASLQAGILQSNVPPVYCASFKKEKFIKNLLPSVCVELEKEWQSKFSLIERAEKLNEVIATSWDAIREEVEQVHIPQEELEQAMLAVGLGITPEAIGWCTQSYDWAVKHAAMTRSRFTFLDLQGD
jgi:glycerol-1-phosphate dehydrogenase [NAD(P)+]